MKLTKREKAMNDAKDKGEDDFSDNRFDDSQYGDDTVLKACYQQGWNMARADYYRFYSNYD